MNITDASWLLPSFLVWYNFIFRACPRMIFWLAKLIKTPFNFTFALYTPFEKCANFRPCMSSIFAMNSIFAVSEKWQVSCSSSGWFIHKLWSAFFLKLTYICSPYFNELLLSLGSLLVSLNKQRKTGRIIASAIDYMKLTARLTNLNIPYWSKSNWTHSRLPKNLQHSFNYISEDNSNLSHINSWFARVSKDSEVFGVVRRSLSEVCLQFPVEVEEILKIWTKSKKVEKIQKYSTLSIQERNAVENLIYSSQASSANVTDSEVKRERWSSFKLSCNCCSRNKYFRISSHNGLSAYSSR